MEMFVQLFAVIFFNCIFISVSQLDVQQCYSTKGCLYKPDNCIPLINCTYFISYSLSQNDMVTMELVGPTEQSGQWVAVGFSDDQKMGDDSVTMCMYSSVSQQNSIGLVHNGNNGPTPISVGTKDSPGNQSVSLISTLVNGTSFLCRFQQKILPYNADSRIRPLNGSYYIFVASGVGDPKTFDIHAHEASKTAEKYPFISNVKINITDTTKYPLTTTVKLPTENGCFKTKGCLFHPPNCTPFVNCEFSLTYSTVSDDNTVYVEMSRNMSSPTDDQWVAFGLSEDQSMGDDTVTYCIYSPTRQQSVVGLASTSGYPTKGVQMINDTNNIVTLLNKTVNGSYFMCTLKQKISLPNTTDVRIKPLNKSYYILIAGGKADIQNTILNYHTSKIISGSKLDMTDKTMESVVTTSTTIPPKDNGCFKTKGCILQPENCTPFVNCQFSLTYALSDNNAVYVELSRSMSSPTDDQWVAFGLSEDKSMGNDAVTYCIYSPSSQKSIAGLAFTTTDPKGVQMINDTNNIVTLLNRTVNGSYFMCGLKQNVTLPNTVTDSRIKSLKDKYYILLAVGKADIQKPTISYHLSKIISASKIDMTDKTYQNIPIDSCTPRAYLFKVHGILMICGWWLFAVVAILFARYFRSLCPNTKIQNNLIWFVDIPKHAIPGLIACICAFLQPVMAAFRCHPGTSNRPVFNWMHRIVGLLGFCCASTAIYYSTEMWTGMNYNYKTPKTLMIIYWAVLVLSVIILELMITLSERLRSPRISNVDSQDVDKNPQQQQEEAVGMISKSIWNPVRFIILGFNTIVALAIVIALCYYIGVFNLEEFSAQFPQS